MYFNIILLFCQVGLEDNGGLEKYKACLLSFLNLLMVSSFLLSQKSTAGALYFSSKVLLCF